MNIDFKAFRKDLDKAMESVANKYNLTLKAGNISYDENTFSVKVTAERTDVDVQKAQFMSNVKYMSYYGFDENDYEANFVLNNAVYMLIGFKPGNKYNVIAKKADGKQYAMVADAVIKAMGKTGGIK